MKSISEVTDLLDESGERHVHSKVMIFGVTLTTFLLLVLIIVKQYELGWPLALVLVAYLYAPFGLDTIKTLVKLRFGPVADAGAVSAKRLSGQMRAIGAQDGVEAS